MSLIKSAIFNNYLSRCHNEFLCTLQAILDFTAPLQQQAEEIPPNQFECLKSLYEETKQAQATIVRYFLPEYFLANQDLELPEIFKKIRHDLAGYFTPLFTNTDDLIFLESSQQFGARLPEYRYIQKLCELLETKRSQMLTPRAIENPPLLNRVEHAQEASAVVGDPTVEQTAAELFSLDQAVHVKPARIMIVDDHLPALEGIQKILKHHQHEIIPFPTGLAALNYLQGPNQKDQIDVILLDIQLGTENGVEILKQIKSMAWVQHVPVVMISGLEDWELIAGCIAAGADDYLTKPIRRALLLSRIKNCLERVTKYRQAKLAEEKLKRSKSDRELIIRNLFPARIAQDIIGRNAIMPYHYEGLAIMFCDIVGFTSYCDQQRDNPKLVVDKLRDMFEKFEQAAEEQKVEKIKTIGDCFMAVAWPDTVENNVQSCLACAQRMLTVAQEQGWQLRIGIHYGNVVAGIAGKRQYCYDMWGDTVNLAARIQGESRENAITISEQAYSMVEQLCQFKDLDYVQVHGKKEPVRLYEFIKFWE